MRHRKKQATILQHGATVDIDGKRYKPTPSSLYRIIELFTHYVDHPKPAHKRSYFMQSTTMLNRIAPPPKREVDFRNFLTKFNIPFPWRERHEHF